MTDTTGAEGDASKMPLIDHLIELRTRLLYSFVGLAIAFVACFIVSEQIYGFLVEPLANATKGDPDRRMIFTGLQEAFVTYLKVAFFGAICLAFPIIASQIWMFVAPGLYKNERRAFLPFLAATPVLFLLGAAMAYYVVFPLAWKFFLSFESLGSTSTLPIELEARVGEYLSLVMKLIFAFGVCFQLPVLLTLLARVGLASSAGLAAKRKYAVVITFAAAAILTPPDLISQVALGIPILILYEVSIIAARFVEKKAEEEDEDDEDEESDS